MGYKTDVCKTLTKTTYRVIKTGIVNGPELAVASMCYFAFADICDIDAKREARRACVVGLSYLVGAEACKAVEPTAKLAWTACKIATAPLDSYRTLTNLGLEGLEILCLGEKVEAFGGRG